ncbi:unnamed protein product, partial [Adineta ricciae]
RAASREQQQSTRRRNDCPDSGSIVGRGFLAPTIINQAQAKLTEDEYHLLKLGPRFIYNDPKTASRRRLIELATVQRKIEARFHEKKVSPGRPVHQFIAELDILLQNLHDIPVKPNPRLNQSQQQRQYVLDIPNDMIISSQPQLIRSSKTKRNYDRSVKRLKHKFRLTNIVLRKTDKSKVFHLGKIDDYNKKSNDYMDKTQAYQCPGTQDPLPDLIQRTNKYLLDLRLAKWITQKQYEQLCVNQQEVELAHLYYLPKAHKTGTPLRPIISGLKHPTIKISKFLDDLLRPLFDKMALDTTVTSGFELLKKLKERSIQNLKQETLLCTIDVADLYTMIPQVEGVLALKKINNYFSLNGQFYHQIRGGAMGSLLTLTISNCYMYFYQQDIVKQISNSGGLYFRYIDDIFLAINWPIRHFIKQVDRRNQFDSNIRLSANISLHADFLDLHMENQNGQLFTNVYHKPSHEPYYLPFNSIHPLHMKKNIPFAMFLRAIRYCSTFNAYLQERESLRMALLLNKYPGDLITSQFNRVLSKFEINDQLSIRNYERLRDQLIQSFHPSRDRTPFDHGKMMFVHYTYCTNMKSFPMKFHNLWHKYFDNSPINEITPILGTKNVDNLQKRLVHTRS